MEKSSSFNGDGLINAILPLKNVLPEFYEKVFNLCGNLKSVRLRIGVVGVTSTGKSKFINGLLGESLLPEQSKPTTNVEVVCRNGLKRKVTVTYFYGKTEVYTGSDISTALVASFCTEDKNPNNEKEVASVEIELPTCYLDEKLEIVDTPGTDAYGHEEHERKVLRECIPKVDIVVFMVRAGRALATPDGKLLENLLENDQRIFFVQSCIDLLKSDRQSTSGEKLQNFTNRLRATLATFPCLSEVTIFGVSSEKACEADGNRKAETWSESGFEAVLRQFEEFAKDLDTLRSETRVDRIRAITTLLKGKILEQEGDIEKKTIMSAEEKNALGKSAFLKQLEATMTGELDVLEKKVTKALSRESLTQKFNRKLNRIFSDEVEVWRNAIKEVDGEWQQLRKEQLDLLDAARIRCRDALAKIGVTPMRQAERAPSLRQFPRADDRVRHKSGVETVVVRREGVWGWIKDLFSTKTETRSWSYTTFDKSGLQDDVAAFVKNNSASILQFITEETSALKKTYLGALRERIAEEEKCLEPLRKFRFDATTQKDALPGIYLRLEEILERLPAKAHSRPAAAPVQTPPIKNAKNVILPLTKVIAMVRESAGISAFWHVVHQASRPSDEIKNILFVTTENTRRTRHLNFLRRQPEHATPSPAASADGKFYEGMLDHWPTPVEVFAFSTDSGISKERFEQMCETASAIAWDFNAAQPGSGLSSLMHCLYFPVLAQSARKLFFISDDGASFNRKLVELYLQIAIGVPRQAGFEIRHWYIYDVAKYDTRYGSFIELVRKNLIDGGDSRALLRQWKKPRQLSHRPPFDEKSLKESYEQIKASLSL